MIKFASACQESGRRILQTREYGLVNTKTKTIAAVQPRRDKCMHHSLKVGKCQHGLGFCNDPQLEKAGFNYRMYLFVK